MTTPTMRPSILVSYGGRPVALVNPRHTTLVGRVEHLPPGHWLLRMATAMSQYAELIATNRLPGPYTDGDAEEFARKTLARRSLPSR